MSVNNTFHFLVFRVSVLSYRCFVVECIMFFDRVPSSQVMRDFRDWMIWIFRLLREVPPFLREYCVLIRLTTYKAEFVLVYPRAGSRTPPSLLSLPTPCLNIEADKAMPDFDLLLLVFEHPPLSCPTCSFWFCNAPKLFPHPQSLT